MAETQIHFTVENLPPVHGLPFKHIARDVLGANYDLSVVFVGKQRAIKLHQNHKGKNGPANVLAFPLDNNTGEIFIYAHPSQRTARSFGLTVREYLLHLFIHAVLHLKGMKHGPAMEHEEDRIFASYRH